MPSHPFVTKIVKPSLKYIGTVIVPVFLGSFILAGALAKYGNNDALNKTIIETAYKPSKEKFRECSRNHNRLFLAEDELAGTYLAIADELSFLLANGSKPLPQEYGSFISALMSQQQALNEEIRKRRQETPLCYEVLYSQLDDLALLLNVTVDVRAVAKRRSDEFNRLEKTRTETAQQKLKGIDPNVVQRALRQGLASTFGTQPEVLLSMHRQLAAHSEALSKVDQQLFEAERKAYGEINTTTTNALESRLKKGIWAFLFG